MSDSPSVGWREMRDEMGVSDGHEPDEADDEWDWSPSIVTPDGEPVDTDGYQWDSWADRREAIGDALREAGDDGLRRVELDGVIGADRHLTNKLLTELREDDLVRAYRPSGSRRQVYYRWVGDLPPEEVPERGDRDSLRVPTAGADIRDAIAEIGLPATSVEIAESAAVCKSTTNKCLRALDDKGLIEREGGDGRAFVVRWGDGHGIEDLPEEVGYQ